VLITDHQTTLPIASVYLRPAGIADCERVYQWNFAADVRQQSRTRLVPPYEEHVAWFASRLRDAWSPIWIIEDKFVPVGVVRIEPVGGVGRISIALAADARGRHLGRQAIDSACAIWRRDVVAEIATDNQASRRCFEAAGFTAMREDGEFTLYHRRGF